MDPNANLAEQRRIAARFIDGLSADTHRLVELVEALDRWISSGGSLPDAWKPDAWTKAR